MITGEETDLGKSLKPGQDFSSYWKCLQDKQCSRLRGKEKNMAENEKKDLKIMSETADAGAVSEGMLDDDQLSEVGGGFNLLDAGVKALSSRSVHRALNAKQSVFAESAGKVFDKVKHPADKK